MSIYGLFECVYIKTCVFVFFTFSPFSHLFEKFIFFSVKQYVYKKKGYFIICVTKDVEKDMVQKNQMWTEKYKNKKI